MSRKNRAPQRKIYHDAKYESLILSKFINFVMYDGKKAAAERDAATEVSTPDKPEEKQLPSS